MNAILVCLIVTVSIVYIWDWVEFPQQIANYVIGKLTNGKITRIELKKPWGCSLCMSTWITLIILACMNWKLIPLCLLFGFSTKYILYIITILDEFLTKLLEYIEYLITH